MRLAEEVLGCKNSLSDYPRISEFLNEKRILSISILDSVWRKENLLLKLSCLKGNYVFKQINNDEKTGEMERVKILKSSYPQLVPDVHVFEDDAYLMDYVEGKGFFDLNKKEKIEKVGICGMLLRAAWKGKEFPKKDISEKIRESFNKYRLKGYKFFSEDELRIDNFDVFKSVPDQISHNDINAANLLYDKRIKLIDPSNEGYNDIARDIGRYCASTFFNDYDRFGNDKKHSLNVAQAFLSNFNDFNPDTLERARYFIGESFLSFLNFQTITVPKSMLKSLAINVLTKKQPLMKSLEESL